MGSLEGLFIEEDSDVEKVMGRRANFGDALGKHSDVSFNLECSDLKIVTDDEDFIGKVEKFIGSHLSGYNPVNQILCDDEEDY
jgi:hypothetical protein